ncbi:MAG: galactose mutarotase [Clostridia bacterium]|nr:galactose mutarotase [Clostridia bacterium]
MSKTVSAVFGALSDGKTITKYIMENKNGMLVTVLDYGAHVQSIQLPRENGGKLEVTVGFDDADGFEHRSNYQGAIAGPYANRIGGGRFEIDGVGYELDKNEKKVTTLHGCGEYTHTLWDASVSDDGAVTFRYVRPDGLHGYPGAIDARVTYSLGDDNRLSIRYDCVSDKKTYINPTNHTYFNLAGFDSGDILSHTLQLNASRFTPVDEYSIPTGGSLPVEGTPMDFTSPRVIGDRIDADFEQLRLTGGYDHNFCIDGADGALRLAATARSEATGVRMNVYTTLPGVQFYAGNFLNGGVGREGKPMNRRCGFCLETQYYPDTPNRPEFPSCLFDAGEHYRSETVYAFSGE